MAISQQSEQVLFDALYCEEEKWEDEEEDEEATSEICDINDENTPSLFPLLLLEQDLFWEDQELLSLFSKEEDQNAPSSFGPADGRRDAVEWILKVNAHYSFTALTAVLAVNYLDRFLSSLRFQSDNGNNNKPWMVQLVAVTCLSLAAKVEETQVPLLLDLQVRDIHCNNTLRPL